MPTGQTVKKSTYQKVVEQNKRLENDIKILVGSLTPEKIALVQKYRNEFKIKI